MSDLTYTVSMPFKRKGAEKLKEREFVFALSMDLNWFNPDDAKLILSNAEKEGLLKREGDLISPGFDISTINIPSGFRPDPGVFEKQSLFERTIERVILKTGMEKRKVISLINKNQETLYKMVEIEVSAILVALEQEVNVDDLIEEEYSALINPVSSS